MSYPRFERTTVSTARELFAMHPGVRASRQRSGALEVYPFHDMPSPFIGFYTIIHLAQQRGSVPQRLGLVAHLAGGEPDTQLFFPYPGSIDAPDEVTVQATRPELVIGMASAGVDLLSGYVSLPPDERSALSKIPYGNEKVYDFVGPELESSVLIAARAMLLLEPTV